MSNNLFNPNFDLETAIAETKDRGYYFATNALSDETLMTLAEEISTLPLEVADHISRPINAGKPNEVQQQHARGYYEYGSSEIPVSNLVIDGLVVAVCAMRTFPELQEWLPREVGYQCYRHSADRIGAHRDRTSDKLLSVTFTIHGSACIETFEPIGDPWTYTDDNLRKTDEFLTSDGSVMLLRAPGLGDGNQVIHKVHPPREGSRTIVNYRMRDSILEQPSHPRWRHAVDYASLSSTAEQETMFLSGDFHSVTEVQTIIDAGEAAIPYLLQDIQQDNTGWWQLDALWTIAHNLGKPVLFAPEDRGKLHKVKYAVIAWAKQNGYVVQ